MFAYVMSFTSAACVLSPRLLLPCVHCPSSLSHLRRLQLYSCILAPHTQLYLYDTVINHTSGKH